MSANLQALRIREEGWHGMGFDLGRGFILDGETPSEAARICGMDQYRYVHDTFYRMVKEGAATYNADGTITFTSVTLRPDEKSKLVAILPNGERLAINRVVDWYDPLQPEDLVRITDPLAEQMQLYGVGILGKRAEIMFVQFELPPFMVGPDEHRAFFLVGDDKRGGGIYQGATFVRVVCNNTWSAAISDLPVFGHSDSAFTVETCTNILAASLRAQEQERDFLNTLFTHKFDKAQRNEYAEAVFPSPAKPAKVELLEMAQTTLTDAAKIAEVETKFESIQAAYETGLELAEARRLHLMTEVQAFNAQMPVAANTGYALFNGLTAMAKPTETVRDAEGKLMFAGDEVNRLANSLFGRGVNGTAVDRGRSWLVEAIK